MRLPCGSPTTSPNAAGWYNTNVSVPFTTSDNLSGVASTNPASSPVVISTEGNAVTGSVTVTDTAGNSATFTTAAFKIDKTAPTFTLALASAQSVQYSDPASMPTTASDVLTPAASLTATATGLPSGIALIQTGNGSWSLQSQQTAGIYTTPPGTYPITVRVTDLAGNYSTTPTTVTVTKEDATADYTGNYLFVTSGANASSTTVNLSATITDNADGARGDIRNASVTFYAYIGTMLTYTIPASTVTLINPADPTVGRVTASYTFDAGQDSKDYTIYIKVNNYYTACVATAIEVARPIAGSINGGGFLTNTAPAGETSAEGMVSPLLTAKTNFGFNVKYNRAGTNPQGKMTIIVRSTDGKTYQVKSSAISALTVRAAPDETVFSSRANITDVTDPNNPILINPGGQQATLDVRLVDMGEPGSSDTVAITVRTPLGLWFSSSHYTVSTALRRLSGGNIQVRPAQLLDGPSGPSAPAGTLATVAQIQSLVPQAIARWQAAGIAPERLAALAAQTYGVDDLPAGELGWQTADTIAIDADGSGYGWFIDATPGDDAEFVRGVAKGPAAGRVDMLTVIMHEMGHVLGYFEDATAANTVMSEGLPVGVRRVPQSASSVAKPATVTNGLAPDILAALLAGKSTPVILSQNPAAAPHGTSPLLLPGLTMVSSASGTDASTPARSGAASNPSAVEVLDRLFAEPDLFDTLGR